MLVIKCNEEGLPIDPLPQDTIATLATKIVFDTGFKMIVFVQNEEFVNFTSELDACEDETQYMEALASLIQKYQ